MNETFHIKIKKRSAVAAIKDLQEPGAVEILPESNIPYWHIGIVNKRLDSYHQNPSIAMDFNSEMDEIENGL